MNSEYIQTVGVFLHIPRTGGTTIRHIIENNLAEHQVLAIYAQDIEHPEQCVQRLHEPTRRALKMIRGHIPFGIHQHLPSVRCLYFSLVRNPIERVWSLWNYAYRYKQHHLCEELRKLKTLQAAVESGVSPEFNDGMCRQLSGIDGPFMQDPYASDLSHDYGDTQAYFDLAIQRFDDRTISMGTTENFDAFLWTICETMGWKNRAYKRSNAGPPFDPSKLTDGDLQALEHYNRRDMELWSVVEAVHG